MLLSTFLAISSSEMNSVQASMMSCLSLSGDFLADFLYVLLVLLLGLLLVLLLVLLAILVLLALIRR